VVEVLLRRRKSAAEGAEEHVHGADRTEGVGFRASLDLLSAAGGRPLSDGLWDLHVRLRRNGLTRTARLGGSRALEELPTRTALRYAAVDDRMWTGATFFSPAGKLTVDVGQTKFKVKKSITKWSVTVKDSTLAVAATTPLEVDVPLTLALVGEEELAFPAMRTTSGFSGEVPLRDVPNGRWAVRVRLGTAPAHQDLPVPARPGLGTVRWRQPLLPRAATPQSAPAKRLVLDLGRVRLVRAAAGAARRRLRHTPRAQH
jgi:CDP-glycerol glycerophosphotransferase